MEVFQVSDKDEEIQKNWVDCEFGDGPSGVNGSFDLRQKISKCRPDDDEDLENKESPSGRRRTRETDLRLKLSRKRENQMDQSSVDRHKRNYEGSERGRRRRWEQSKTKYTERVGGLSPLRSPRASTLGSILDLDNSHNHRFTKRFVDSSSPIYATKRLSNQGTPGNDNKEMSPRMESTLVSDSDDEEITSTTPEYSRKASRLDRTSWTRRRLQLPLERAEDEVDRNSRLPAISEEDKVRLARREKDIAYGKNTDAYRMYTELIPRELRSENSKKHPRTPKKNKLCSRRSWDAQVKLWKKRIHAWASEHNNQETAEETSISDCESPLPRLKNSWANIVARGHLLEEKEENSSTYTKEDNSHEGMEAVGLENAIADGFDDEVNLSDEENSHAFLDSADIDFAVADQVQQQVRLEED